MRILCLTDFQIPRGRRWLWDYIPNNEDQVEFLFTHTEDKYPSWGKLINYYPTLVKLGLRAQRKIKQGNFDLIVAWEGKCGFPLAILRGLRDQSKPPLVILSFSIRGPIRSFPGLLRLGSRGMNYATVPTAYEKEYYEKQLNIAGTKLYHCQLGTPNMFQDLPQTAPGEMIFSGGRSGRDYHTFFKAIEGFPGHVMMAARKYNTRGLKIPANVELHDLLPWYAYSRALQQARIIVVPLKKLEVSIGLSVILDSMSAGRAVVASDLPGLREYIRQGETGLLVRVGDNHALRETIEYLWARPDLCSQMGKRAREEYLKKYTFSHFAQRVDQVLKDIVDKV